MSFLSNLFGGNSAPQVNFNPSGIVNPTGTSITPGGVVSQSQTLQNNIGSLQGTFGAQAGALSNLASTVGPGFSNFRAAGLQDITNQFNSSFSNLKQNLAQRGIAGSSFANASYSNMTADEASTKANFEANSYLQELQAQYQLIQAQYTAQTQQYSTAINQSNIDSALAASLTASNNQIAGQIATANANLQAQAQAGAGSFLGTLLGIGASSLGKNGAFGSGGAFGGLSSGGSSVLGTMGSVDAADAGATTIDSFGADVLPLLAVA